MFDLSVSIVTYQPDLAVIGRVLACLEVALSKVKNEFAEYNFVVYLIDNSPDSVHMSQLTELANNNCLHAKVNVIKSEKNLGYGKANNLAINKIQSKYHLVLNPDVFVQEDSLLIAIKYMNDNPEFALLTPAVFGENGDRHYLCKRNPTIIISFLRSFAPQFLKQKYAKKMALYEMRDKNYDEKIIDIPFPTGCFMFFRTAVLKQLNGFDEKFFMYFEDADIGRRVLELSHSIYLPQVKIIHKWARDSHTNSKLKLAHIKSAIIYSLKWQGLL